MRGVKPTTAKTVLQYTITVELAQLALTASSVVVWCIF